MIALYPYMHLEMELLGFLRGKGFDPVQSAGPALRLGRRVGSGEGGAIGFCQGDRESRGIDRFFLARHHRIGETAVVDEQFALQPRLRDIAVRGEVEDEDVGKEVRRLRLEHARGEADFLDSVPAEIRRKTGRQGDAFAAPGRRAGFEVKSGLGGSGVEERGETGEENQETEGRHADWVVARDAAVKAPGCEDRGISSRFREASRWNGARKNLQASLNLLVGFESRLPTSRRLPSP